MDRNDDGVVSFAEADVNGTSDGLTNPRLYLPPTASNWFAITREINDGLLARRRHPSHSRPSGGTCPALAPRPARSRAGNSSTPPLLEIFVPSDSLGIGGHRTFNHEELS
jgi:hypothetical protein